MLYIRTQNPPQLAASALQLKVAMYSKVFITLTLAILAVAERRRFDGYQLWTATPETDTHVRVLDSLKQRVTFWSDARVKGYLDEFLVPPTQVSAVGRMLKNVHLSYSVKLENYQDYLDALWKRLDNKALDYDYDDYNSLESFETELQRLTDVCASGLLCELESVGTTWEDRDMWRLKISDATNPSDQIVWLDSLTHPNEWLSGATNMLILRHMVEDYETDTEVQDLFSRFTFYFMPVVNPDGYEYTWTDDREWRKNARPADEGTGCLGVNINRNYDYYWGEHSEDECTDGNYHGPSPASEPETQVLQTQADTVNALVWITYHTYVPIWLLPYANPIDGECPVPDNYDDELKPVAQATVEAIAGVNGEPEWDFGAVCIVLANASGDSLGYLAGEAGVRFPFAPELRGPGFDPPPSVIPLSYEENWAGLVALLNEAESIVNS